MVFVALAMTLVPRHGATGLAWATLGAECALVFTQGIYVESAMAQGSLKPNVGLFARSVGVIALQYAVWVALPTVWSATIAALLAILVSLPFLYRVVSRRLRA
jgi:hypothetical protein